MRLRHGRVLSPADEAHRNGLGEADGLARSQTPTGSRAAAASSARATAPMRRTRACRREGSCAGLCQMMAGKIVEIVKQVPSATSWSSGALRETRRDGSPAPGDSKPPGARRGAVFRGPGRSALGPRKRDGARSRPREGSSATTRASSHLQPLKDFHDRVDFKTLATGRGEGRGQAASSASTWAPRRPRPSWCATIDHAIVASVYLRTNGDPVRASRDCYRSP